ncbi:hypothetical protein KSC_041280 [Ktedonobacter sp. SOSP1-52]|uniref:putative quinol monooxygenase n=1 Tax=Ktedonobacter sp. SOSP1-52 TaxID=2778366 RepID=UPI0019158465|nr:antibiotic biosynthesis monooxygenase [Ktedonobacter sp. SOSP1-52]GHO65236.1 hypothetical protein KSC_041280 [Ktedonobacter sp. SOSP1-52]
MVTVGFLIRYEAKPGKEADVERVLKEGLAAVQEEPATTAWFAFRLGSSTFGVFDAFPDEEGRLTHFNARAAQLQALASELFVEGSLIMEKIDILAAKLPG